MLLITGTVWRTRSREQFFEFACRSCYLSREAVHSCANLHLLAEALVSFPDSLREPSCIPIAVLSNHVKDVEIARCGSQRP